MTEKHTRNAFFLENIVGISILFLTFAAKNCSMSGTNAYAQSAPQRFNGNNYDEKSVVITFVWRDMNLKERCFFRQNVKILGQHPFCIVHPKSYSVDYLKQEYPGLSSLALDDTHFQSVWTYNNMMLSPWFYDLFSDFEYMLICQTDAYVFSDQLNHWVSLGYDYIGAPWMLNDKPYERLIGQWVIRVLKKQPIRNNRLHSAHLFHNVGNGGFSLRRISKMKEIMERNQELVQSVHGKHEKMEDIFISIILKAKENLNIPHWKQALYFSFEKAPAWCLKLTKGVFPFGCHDTNARYWDSFWKHHIPLEE